MQEVHDMHNVNCAQDVRFIDRIDKAESTRFSSNFKTVATTGFQPTDLRPTEYITNWIKVIDNGPGRLSDQAMDMIVPMEAVQRHIVNANHSDSLEQAETFANLCNLNTSLTTEDKK